MGRPPAGPPLGPGGAEPRRSEAAPRLRAGRARADRDRRSRRMDLRGRWRVLAAGVDSPGRLGPLTAAPRRRAGASLGGACLCAGRTAVATIGALARADPGDADASSAGDA